MRKANIYGLTCPFFVYYHKCDLDKEYFMIFPPLRRRETYESKKEKCEDKDEGAHMWATVRKSGNNALPPQRIVLQSYLASCRHLWYM